jgi:hypothetical protein
LGQFLLGPTLKKHIVFVDQNGQPNSDYIDGLPVISVDIDVSFKPRSDPNEQFVINFTNVLAIIDTGSNATMISERLVGTLPPIREIIGHSMAGPGVSYIYQPLIHIPGMLEPEVFEVGRIPLKPPLDAIVGRDILSRFTLVMDTPGKLFYLERR